MALLGDNMKDTAIIINTCNRPFLLRSLVDQVKEQKDQEDQIIVVNDGDEGTIQGYVWERAEVIQHCKPYYALASGRNKGVNKAHDLGFSWAIILDDDLSLRPNWIKEHKESWEDHKTIYAGKIVKREGGTDIREHWWNGEGNPIIKYGGCNIGFYLPEFVKTSGWNEDFDGAWGCEDNDLYWRLKNKWGWEVEYVPGSVVTNLKAPPSGDYVRNNEANLDKLEMDATYLKPEPKKNGQD